jgi:FHA domain
MPHCPDGHDSTSTDFCDVCGLAMGPSGSVPVATVVTAPVLPAETCPECGEPRTGRFCEGCSYDFVAGASRTPVATPSAPPVTTPPPSVPGPDMWSVVVSADRDYFDAVLKQEGPDAAAIVFPAYCPDRHFPLTGEQIRVGRLSRSRGMVPEIDLTGPPQDPGVSHLHAVLLPQPDGGWAVVDPGSTNGTTVNDDIEPIRNDVAVPVRDGDRIHVGAWTTITVRAPNTA